MKYSILIISFLMLISCNNTKKEEKIADSDNVWNKDYQAISKLGDTLYATKPSQELLDKYEKKREAYDKEASLDNIIWYGRFTAYAGDYRKAIDIYTKGLEKYPNESRLLRHRGHRYISVREFDNAIADLSLAAQLIEGTENSVEEDGMPNAQNIPVSTKHGNIYYHLGLAHYLKGNFQKAIDAYKQCLRTSNSPDNVVSATHWIYSINCQMGRMTTAQNYLRNIEANMEVIENDAYLKACLLYKGLLTQEDLQLTAENAASNSALKYALGNHLLCVGRSAEAKQIFEEMVAAPDWASFGHIAAEVDLARKF